MFDERFARQYRYGPPSAFQQTSTYTGIVHHLSGPDRNAPLKPFTEDQGRLAGHALCFHCARGLATRVLAHVSDSLVRVSRRVRGTRSVSRRSTRDVAKESPKPRQRTCVARRAAADPPDRSAPRNITAESARRSQVHLGFMSPISSTL